MFCFVWYLRWDGGWGFTRGEEEIEKGGEKIRKKLALCFCLFLFFVKVYFILLMLNKIILKKKKNIHVSMVRYRQQLCFFQNNLYIEAQ